MTYSNISVGGGVITADAQVADGYAWDDEGMPEGWTIDENDPSKASFAGTYVEAPCAPVIPVNPVVNQAVCTGGAIVEPTVTTTDTDRVSYEIVGTVENGGSVTIVATLADGYAWDTEDAAWPEGWTVTEGNPAEATKTINLNDVECAPTQPVLPTVVQAVCTGGGLVDPSITLDETEGVTYEIQGQIKSGATVTIVATIQDGYEWDMIPEGWTKVDDATATATITLEDIKCTPVVPGMPEVTPAVCEEGKVVDPSVVVPTTPGVTYTTSGEAKAGGKMTITATIGDGYEWGELPAGWTKVDPTTATYEITFAGITCETPPVVTELPKTGSGQGTSSNGILLATLAGAILVAGAVRTTITKRT